LLEKLGLQIICHEHYIKLFEHELINSLILKEHNQKLSCYCYLSDHLDVSSDLGLIQQDKSHMFDFSTHL